MNAIEVTKNFKIMQKSALKINANRANIALLNFPLKTEQVRPPVSQSEKTHLPTIKIATAKGLTVGSNPKPFAHASEQAGVHTHEENDLKAMLHLNKLLVHLMPELKVCYHNTLYVQQISENYSLEESAIFLQWVKTFALLRRSEKTPLIENIITTDEEDFLSAFKLMQQRKIAEYADVNPKCKNKVLDLLKLKFQYRTFSAQILAKELFYNYKLLDKIIMLLCLEHQIEFVKELSEQQFYRLREKSKVYVEC